MGRLFLECAVRAALIVGATAVVLYAMRVKAATAKHSVWTAIVALMLLLPIWTAWGPKASLRVLPPVSQSLANKTNAPIEIFSTGSVRSTSVDPELAVLLGVYLSGLFLLLFRLGLGTVRARRLVRDAVLHDGVLTSLACAAPVTVGFFHPTVIFPEHWRQWPQAQFDAVLTHEAEHARCRHPFVQWLALLNRAVFWFHPVAWWLERHLSALAEEACDNVVLALGYDRRAYSEYLIDMSRSVKRSGARLSIAGMAMPGSYLERRIRQILESGPVPRTSRVRIGCVYVACAILSTAVAAGTLDHAQPNSSTGDAMLQSEAGSAAHPTPKFVVDELRIEGDVHNRNGVRERVLKAWKNREYDNSQEPVDEAGERIRAEFQERGYFQVVVHAPSSRPLGVSDGKQSILIIASVAEGDQFRLRSISMQNVTPDRALSISTATLREQFHLRDGDVFNMTEIRTGLDRLRQIYVNQGYVDATAMPDTKIDSASKRIDLTLRITEGVGVKQSDNVLFDRAVKAMQQSEYAAARTLLETLINSHPDSDYVPRAKLSVADASYAQGNFRQAEVEYRDFITFFSNRPEVAEAQLKIEAIHRKAGI
jgi:beta-lactamase regulating signal transducer with metallopeptidase domain